MNEKIAVGFALISIVAITMFFNEERISSAPIIEEKKALYNEKVAQEKLDSQN